MIQWPTHIIRQANKPNETHKTHANLGAKNIMEERYKQNLSIYTAEIFFY